VRIPFPERIPIDRAALFAVILFLIQTLEGTPLYFSAGCVAFLLLATFAFNTAGGLTRASGAYIFFYSILVVVIGITYKAFLGERADSNLRDPKTTIGVYVGGMAAMLAAVTVSRRFSRKTGLLQNLLKETTMYRSSVGCFVFGIGGAFAINLLGAGGAKLNSAFTQLNQLVPLGIIIGVMYEIRRSGETRSINIPVAVTAIYYFFIYGLLGFSKQGMLAPVVCWLMPVCALRYRLSRLQIFGFVLGMLVLFQYLVPYSQYGRRFLVGDLSLTQKIALTVRLIGHPEDTRQHYEEVERELDSSLHYYDRAEGFWDRLTFISIDDSLIDVTNQVRTFGYTPLIAAFVNAVPHFILPDKPTLNFGNLYAHEIGILPTEDTTTGISFSPTAEAYHMGKWTGVLVVAPIVWFLIFVSFDSVFGDLRQTPWGLLVLAALSHTAPEAALNGAIYLLTFQMEAFIFCALFATWVAPTLAVVVLGRDRRAFRSESASQISIA
jgi:hypothetical protein